MLLNQYIYHPHDLSLYFLKNNNNKKQQQTNKNNNNNKTLSPRGEWSGEGRGSERLVPMLEKASYNALFRVAFFQQTCNPFTSRPVPHTPGKRWTAFLWSPVFTGVPHLLFFYYYFLSFFYYFFIIFTSLVPQKILYANPPFLFCNLWKFWRAATNVAVAVTPLCPYMYLSDKITNARNILVDNFIECNSFIIATVCPNLLHKLKQYVFAHRH